jgi:hypothetical protein
MLCREKTIDRIHAGFQDKLVVAECKNTVARQLQSSQAFRSAQPFYSDVSRWFLASAKSTGNFLYRNLIEKPVAELGYFSEYYLDYLQTITVEQCVIAVLSDNPHSLFHLPVNK